MTKDTIINFLWENAAIGGLYLLGLVTLIAILKANKTLRAKSVLMVEKKWVFNIFGIWRREFEIPESVIIKKLQEENSVLKMEIEALKSTKRILAIILAVVGAAIIFIAFGKRIIDVVANLFREANKANHAEGAKTETDNSDFLKGENTGSEQSSLDPNIRSGQ